MSVSSESLNFPGQCVLGTVSSFVVNAVTHPLHTVKTRMMTDPEIRLRQAIAPEGIYKGVSMMFLSDAFVFATAYYANNELNKLGYSKLNASLLTGVGTALIASIGEGAAANLQVNKESKLEIIKRISRPAGFIATVSREIPFAMGVFYLSPKLKTLIKEKFPESPDLLSTGVAGSLSGSMVGCLTSPVDLIRTRIQTHEKSISIWAAAQSVKAGEGGGWRGLWRGAGWRSMYIGLATAGMNMVEKTLTGHLPKALHADV